MKWCIAVFSFTTVDQVFALLMLSSLSRGEVTGIGLDLLSRFGCSIAL